MDAEVPKYLPYIFRSFQGFQTRDIKEFIKDQRMQIILESDKSRKRLCNRCGHELGAMHDRYWVRAMHLRAFNWSVDEVYARSPKQQKEGETRDDLFLTVIVDHRTRKVIWVSQSRRKEALDTFFCDDRP